jgi:16S rRNA (uracil1498-N3)-methyltransferase
MRLTRIYQPQALSSGEIYHLSLEATHHLIHVLRLSVGAEFILFNGIGGEFTAKIIALEKKRVCVQVGKFNPINRESPLQIILAQTITRPDKMDFVLQKAVELGVTHLVPLITARCSLQKLTSERWQKRLLHWQAILVSACEQSGRTRIPTLSSAVSLQTALQDIKADLRFMLRPDTTQAFPRVIQSCHRVAVLVGPEGGWSETEIKLAKEQGYLSLQLGPRILRTETAGLVALTLLQALLGDISLNLV